MNKKQFPCTLDNFILSARVINDMKPNTPDKVSFIFLCRALANRTSPIDKWLYRFLVVIPWLIFLLMRKEFAPWGKTSPKH